MPNCLNLATLITPEIWPGAFADRERTERYGRGERERGERERERERDRAAICLPAAAGFVASSPAANL